MGLFDVAARTSGISARPMNSAPYSAGTTLRISQQIRRRAVWAFRICWFVAATIFLHAQTADPPLTNADIASVLYSRLPESTIVVKIQKAARLG